MSSTGQQEEVAKPMVLISGAGIAGLSLAIFLRRTGRFEVRVLERSPELCPALGAHFALNGALACLDRAGLRHVWEPYCHELKQMRYQRPEGDLLAKVDVGRMLQGTELEGRCGIFMRGEVQGSLARELPEGVVECGKEIVDVHDKGGRVRVDFKDGSSTEGDLLIATDGINSMVRKIVFGGVGKVFSGTKMWLMVHDDPAPAELQHRITEVPSQDALTLAFGAGSRGQLVVAVIKHAPEPTKEELERDRTPERFREVFAEAGVFRAGLMREEQLASANRLLHFGVYSMPPGAPSWSSGRICLLGDAAHATTPFMGQGANQAVQSAFCLARLLQERGVDQYEAVFQEFHRIREPPTSAIINMSKMAKLRIPAEDEGCLAGVRRSLFYALLRFAPGAFGRTVSKAMQVNA